MLAALKAEWQPILTAQSPDPPQYFRGLDYVGGLEPWDFSSVSIPTVSKIKRFLGSAKNTRPGLDGIPYAGWLKAGEIGCRTLFLVSQDLRNFGYAGPGFNHFLPIFVPTKTLSKTRDWCGMQSC